MSHRPSSIHSSTTSLQTRINQKRTELENLQALRALSAQLATQMSTLEQKLATLRDGTEAVAEVLQNWNGVLGVLGMVGQKLPGLDAGAEGAQAEGDGEGVREQSLPPTLVRVPVQQQQLEKRSEGVKDGG